MWRRQSDKRCVIALKGTCPTCKEEVADDLNMKTKVLRDDIKIAKGFYNYVVNQMNGVRTATRWISQHGCEGDILITGHSLGGAAADILQIATDEMASRSIVYTFGEPLVYIDRESAGAANRLARRGSLKRFVGIDEESFLGQHFSSLDAVTLLHQVHHGNMVHRTVGVGLYGAHPNAVHVTPWGTNNLYCADFGVHSVPNYRANMDYFMNSSAALRFPNNRYWHGFDDKMSFNSRNGNSKQNIMCRGDRYSCPIWQDTQSADKPWVC